MWIHVNKETKRIEGYTEECLGNLVNEECELIEVDEIDDNWMYSKYENSRFVLDEDFKRSENEKSECHKIRVQREVECFTFINRGNLWYETLSENQKSELNEWYQNWLDAPQTKIIPLRPSWLK